MNDKSQNTVSHKAMMPYEKFLLKGPESLSDEELLAILIRTGTKDEDSVSLGRRVLSLSKGSECGILGLRSVSISELMEIKGIGQVKAIKIKCVTELSRRLVQASRRETVSFREPASVAAYYMEQLRHECTEQVLLLLTDNKCRLIHEMVLSKGTVDTSLLSPREVFLQALKYQAVHILLLHNHPSGDASPSRQDIEITKRLDELGTLLQLSLLDHIIIGDNCYVSFRESGLI